MDRKILIVGIGSFWLIAVGGCGIDVICQTHRSFAGQLMVSRTRLRLRLN